MIHTKICGIKDLEALNVAIKHGVRYLGFVFYPPSARFVSTDQARVLCRHVPTGVKAVGLFVDPTNTELDRIATTVQLDMIQLHGDETPGRVQEIKDKYSLQVMKAIRVAEAEDLQQVEAFESVVDWLMFDTKTNSGYGGSGHAFDWSILKDRTFKKPWMLAGGLNISNVEKALSVLSPNAVDISSGVESAKGVKDPQKIKEFLDFIKK